MRYTVGLFIVVLVIGGSSQGDPQSLLGAVQAQKVNISAKSANGLKAIELTISNRSSETVMVDVFASVFQSSASLQRLGVPRTQIADSERVISIAAGGTWKQVVPSFCLDSQKKAPPTGQVYRLSPSKMSLPNKQALAIWNAFPDIPQDNVQKVVWHGRESGLVIYAKINKLKMKRELPRNLFKDVSALLNVQIPKTPEPPLPPLLPPLKTSRHCLAANRHASYVVDEAGVVHRTDWGSSTDPESEVVGRHFAAVYASEGLVYGVRREPRKAIELVQFKEGKWLKVSELVRVPDAVAGASPKHLATLYGGGITIQRKGKRPIRVNGAFMNLSFGSVLRGSYFGACTPDGRATAIYMNGRTITLPAHGVDAYAYGEDLAVTRQGQNITLRTSRVRKTLHAPWPIKKMLVLGKQVAVVGEKEVAWPMLDGTWRFCQTPEKARGYAIDRTGGLVHALLEGNRVVLLRPQKRKD
jgi:hypothetical protein